MKSFVISAIVIHVSTTQRFIQFPSEKRTFLGELVVSSIGMHELYFAEQRV